MKVKLLIGLFVLTALIQFTGCADSEANSEKVKEEKKYTLVETMKVVPEEYSDAIFLIGTVKPSQIAHLSSLEGGKIKKFYAEKGSFVKTDDVILEIDNDMLKANLDAAKAQYDLAEINFKKQEQIFKESVTSEIQYLQSKYERDAAKANYELIKARYEHTFIRAPFSGFIDSKNFEVGEVVSPGMPIVSLINSSEIKVTAGVPENFVNDVKVGTACKLKFKDVDDKVYSAKVSFVSKTITTSNRTFMIEIKMLNPNQLIKPELNSEIMVERGKYSKAFLVPENVVTKTDIGDVVFVADGDVAKMRTVVVLNRIDNKAAIIDGLKSGDNLIVVGYQNLIDGEKVEIVK